MKIGEEPHLLNVTGETKTISSEKTSVINKSVLLNLLKEYNFNTSQIYWQSADHVTFGLYTGENDGSLLFTDYVPEWEYLQELRVFNDESELRIWRYGKTYHGRIIADKEAINDESVNCLEQNVNLWGTYATKSSDQFIILQEERGMKLALPVKFEDRFNTGINAFLKERLYLNVDDDTGCVFISDRRFCGFYVADDYGQLIEVKL